jgi:hypothetical protein
METRLPEPLPDELPRRRLLRRSATALAIASKSTLGILSLLIDVDRFRKAEVQCKVKINEVLYV